MVGKHVQFDDEVWEAVVALAQRIGSPFQELADEAFADLLKKHKQPIGLIASLKESVGEKAKPRQTKRADADRRRLRYGKVQLGRRGVRARPQPRHPT